TSSRSTAAFSRKRLPFRKTSTQTEVSTSTTPPPPAVPGWTARWGCVAPHLGDAPFPQPRSCKTQDAARPRPANELLESPVHGGRVGPLPAHLQRFLEGFCFEPKICAF